MACPATTDLNLQARVESDSDYGSDFSSEEELLINRLLAGQEGVEGIEDNPILTGLEYHEPVQTVRVPRVLGRERINDILPEGSVVAEVHNLSSAAFHSGYPDCELFPIAFVIIQH
jgi:hypothetical protein